MWAINLLQKERTEGRLKIEATIYANIINSFEYLETCNRRIFNHGWVNFPFGRIPNLIETQVIFKTEYEIIRVPTTYICRINM
jgi:hypothetical protein